MSWMSIGKACTSGGGLLDYAVAGSPRSALPVNAGWRRRPGHQASMTRAASNASSMTGQRLRLKLREVQAIVGVDISQPTAIGTRQTTAGRSCHTIHAAALSRQRSEPWRYGATSSDPNVPDAMARPVE